MKKFTLKKKLRLRFDREKWGTLIAVFGMGVLLIAVDYCVQGEVEPLYYFVFLVLCLIASISTVSLQTAKYEYEKQKLLCELQKVYGKTYEELISEVRRKQHDFMNQLSVIYSMHLTADSLEDLIQKQSAYGNILLEECRYDKILMGCNHPILAGYLYYRCVAYENDHVQVDYEVHVDKAECCLSMYEIIEMLGILLTNAFESYRPEEEEKRISLVVQEGIHDLTIEVSNKAEEFTSKEIEMIFRKGYSSKGKNRGLGLARLKQLTMKADADLIVENRKRGEQNWINFRIRIPKYKGE